MYYSDVAVPTYNKVKSKMRRIIYSNWYVDHNADDVIAIEFNGKFYDIDISGEVPVVTGDNKSVCNYIENEIIAAM